jgi:flagellar motor component MotA
MIMVIALFSFAAWKAGTLLGVPIAGALVGGFVGALVAFAATYIRFRDL